MKCTNSTIYILRYYPQCPHIPVPAVSQYGGAPQAVQGKLPILFTAGF